jgi:hypothetical protein
MGACDVECSKTNWPLNRGLLLLNHQHLRKGVTKGAANDVVVDRESGRGDDDNNRCTVMSDISIISEAR